MSAYPGAPHGATQDAAPDRASLDVAAEGFVNLEPLDHPTIPWLRDEVSQRDASRTELTAAQVADIASTPDPHSALRVVYPASHVSFAIDHVYTKYIDDAIALDHNDGPGVHDEYDDALLVHIADPTRFLAPHGPHTLYLQSALRSGGSLYLPSCAYPMFPPLLCQQVFSLGGKLWDGCVLTVRLVRMPHSCAQPFAASVFLSRIPPPRRYTYCQARNMLAGTAPPSADTVALQRLARLFGPLMQHGPNIEHEPCEIIDNLATWNVRVRVRNDVPLPILTPGTGAPERGNEFVPACMALASRAAGALTLADPRLALVFRATRRDMQNESTLDPDALLLGASGAAVRYARVTSPLRRVDDLLNHLQLKAHIEGAACGLYGRDELARLVHVQNEFEQRRWVARTVLQQFWTIRYYKRFVRRGWNRLTGTVMRGGVKEYWRRVNDGSTMKGRPGVDCVLVNMDKTGAVCGAVPQRSADVEGTRVRVRVDGIDFDGLVLDLEVKRMARC